MSSLKYLFYKKCWIFPFLLKENAIFYTPFLKIVSFWHLRLEQSSTAPRKGPGSSWEAVWSAFQGFYYASMNVLESPTLHNYYLNKKNNTGGEVDIKMWDFWLEWTPTAVRWGPWNPWEPPILQFRGSNSLFHVLVRCSVMFSHILCDNLISLYLERLNKTSYNSVSLRLFS